MRNKIIIVVVLIALVVMIGYFWTAPGKYDDVADCLTAKGVTFYGAHWCPHCKAQKAMFGKSMDRIVYVECADPVNPKKQTQACKDADINSYPTWIFPDGTRMAGTVEVIDLARKANCNV